MNLDHRIDGDPVENRDSSDQITDSRKRKVPGSRPALEVESRIGLVAVVVMVVPIAIRAPAVAVFIPPAMAMFPTPSARFGKLMAIFYSLRAVPAMMLGGFMEFVIRVGDAPLAVVVRVQWCGAREKKRGAQGSGGKKCANPRWIKLSLHSFSDNAAAENDLRRDVRKEGQGLPKASLGEEDATGNPVMT